MLYRHEDGSFTISTPDGEHSQRLTKEEGHQLLRDRGCPPDLLATIMSETIPGFVMT